ncbi:glycosyltransferase family 4 protein [bacterium]|nr:glycosyltransferase family 4 protein [bacterium]
MNASATEDLLDLTVVNFFPAFTPPRSGGEMRYYHLCRGLSERGFRVRMFSPTFPEAETEEVHHGPNCTERRFPQNRTHVRLYRVMNHIFRQEECSGLVVSLGARFHRDFLRAARESIASSRVVIFEFPFPLSPFLKGIGRRPLIVHNAYNVEGLMQREVLRGPQGKMFAAWIGRHQRNLCRQADVVFACSREDATTMTRLYDVDPTKIYIVPNGVETDRVLPVRSDLTSREKARARIGLRLDRPVALFLGSAHAPNQEAARFLMNRVAPACPEVNFVLAGSVCDALGREPFSENVTLLGRFEEEQKADLLQAASVAVNPMSGGSGTNLKMLEFFSARLPVLSTPVGARGLDGAGTAFLVREAEDFAASLNDLLPDEARKLDLGKSARAMAEGRYDWRSISDSAAEILLHKTTRRVLVLNDFPVTPARSGGSVRIVQHYRQVARRFHVTILTQTPAQEHGRHVPAPGVEEIQIPENALKRFLRKALYGLIGVGADDLAAWLTCRFDTSLREVFRRESRFAQTVVLTHPYLAPLARGNELPIVYESLNVETDLKGDLYGNGFWARWGKRRVKGCEEEAVRIARIVSACSSENARRFQELFPNAMSGSLILAPNGVDCGAHERDVAGASREELKRLAGLEGVPVAVFLGSGHPPNLEATLFILERLAPAFPETLFLILGSVCWMLDRRVRPRNALFFHSPDEATKNRLLAMADVALNPLTAGSGVSLKILDYLAAGTAVLSTPVGARGVAVENGVQGILCPLDGFHKQLGRLLRDESLRDALSKNGKALARDRYDWSVTAVDFANSLENLVSKAAKARKSTSSSC